MTMRRPPIFPAGNNPCGTAAVAVCLFLAALALSDDACAQIAGRNPFGVGDAAPPAGAPGGFVAWLLMKQADLTRGMIAALRETRSGAGAGALISVAFLYGVFHAAGPGHGKAVVSSYIFANEQTLRRGIGIAVAAAVLQALVAITLVVPAVTLLGAGARQIDRSVAWIEIIAFTGIMVLGLSLSWRKFKALRAAWSSASAPACPSCGHAHGLAAPGAPAHVHGPECSHVHLPEAAALSGDISWRELVAVTIAAGARPCSGAIILLAFALSAGALAAGIAAVFAMAAGTALTTAAFAAGAVLAKGLTQRLAAGSERFAVWIALAEWLAALCVFTFGLALLLGYMSIG